MSALADTAAPTHHSPATALDAIKSLSISDKSALLKIAKTYARTRHTRFDHEDLIQEAMTRVLEGTRKWPVGVPFMAFLCGVIRSTAWDWRTDITNESELDEIGRPEESDAMARIDAQKLLALFDDDPIAQKLVVGMMEGARGEELWESMGLTKIDYESKRKKIRRRIEKHWLNES